MASGFGEDILREPVDRGIRLVALSLIDDAKQAADALTSAADDLRNGGEKGDEALHDFRVAVRHVRSWIRAFKPQLKKSLSKKHRRALSSVSDATRRAREAAVHVKWLQGERRALSARHRVGLGWLADQEQDRRRSGCDDALESASDLATIIPKIANSLNEYSASVRQPDTNNCFGVAFAEAVRKAGDELRSTLASIHKHTDIEGVHAARIAAKNLRYLADPIVGATGDGDDVISSLKGLQDRLGQLHDIHVLSQELVEMTEKAAASRARRVSEVVLATVSEDGGGNDEIKRARARDPGPGLLGLARLLHDRGIAKFAEIRAEWLGTNGSAFFDRLNDFASRVGLRVSSGNKIEHKYLLKRVPAVALEAPSVEIEQGYLPGEKLIERIRRVTLPDGAERWVRTVKSGNGLSRFELEEESDPDLSRALWALTRGGHVHKRRYTVRESDNLVWEIDEFLDRDLVLAEVEVPSAQTNVDLPKWLTEVLDRDVTDDAEFSNAHLARATGPTDISPLLRRAAALPSEWQDY